jgi:hypothetical protein
MGQAMVLSWSGLITAGETDRSLVRHYISMNSRKRVTLDGGTSVLVICSTGVVPTPANADLLVAIRFNIPELSLE